MISTVVTGASLTDRVKSFTSRLAGIAHVVSNSIEEGIAINRRFHAMVAANRSKPAGQRLSDAEICRRVVESSLNHPVL